MSKTTAKRPDSSDYRALFVNGVPLLDVRAPAEFAKGAFPGAVNLPLMTDKEREAVGITYKEMGQDAAIAIGHGLVGGGVKAGRVAGWAEFAAAHPEGYLYCMRGGLRSQISREWLQEAGTAYPLVSGGYKALRRFLIEETERLAAAENFVVVAGRTGVGKTVFLGQVAKSLDLEGLAHHRGSSFGRRLGDQPSQINFENSLAVRLMQIADRLPGPIFIEDESHHIGQVALPQAILERITIWPALMIEEPIESRISEIHKDYVTDMLPGYEQAYPVDGFEQFGGFLLNALARIRKRLGGVRYAEIEALMRTALADQERTGDNSLHREWISALLTSYYDPMYDYQLSKSTRQVVFTGTRSEALEWQQEQLARAK